MYGELDVFSLLGIGYAMSLLGPAIGYVLGGQLLNVYIDIQIPERQDIKVFCFLFSFPNNSY